MVSRKPCIRGRQVTWWKIRNIEGNDAYKTAQFDKLEGREKEEGGPKKMDFQHQ